MYLYCIPIPPIIGVLIFYCYVCLKIENLGFVAQIWLCENQHLTPVGFEQEHAHFGVFYQAGFAVLFIYDINNNIGPTFQLIYGQNDNKPLKHGRKGGVHYFCTIESTLVISHLFNRKNVV